MLATELIVRARDVIQDVLSVRWPLPELCRWLNDGQREIILQKPSASSTTTTLPLQAGTLQTVPAEFYSILRVTRNATDRCHRAVTVIERDLLDAQDPDWHDARPRSDARHVMIDEADMTHFYVYPPNDGTGKVEAIVSQAAKPVVVSDGEDPDELESYAKPIGLKDIYANVLLDYILYRAYSKDAQVAGAFTRASGHYSQFAQALGIKVSTDANTSPNARARVAPAAGGTA